MLCSRGICKREAAPEHVLRKFELNENIKKFAVENWFAHRCAEESPSNELCLPAERGRKKSKEAAHKLEATRPDLHLICNLNRLWCLSITNIKSVKVP